MYYIGRLNQVASRFQDINRIHLKTLARIDELTKANDSTNLSLLQFLQHTILQQNRKTAGLTKGSAHYRVSSLHNRSKSTRQSWL